MKTAAAPPSGPTSESAASSGRSRSPQEHEGPISGLRLQQQNTFTHQLQQSPRLTSQRQVMDNLQPGTDQDKPEENPLQARTVENGSLIHAPVQRSTKVMSMPGLGGNPGGDGDGDRSDEEEKGDYGEEEEEEEEESEEEEGEESGEEEEEEGSEGEDGEEGEESEQKEEAPEIGQEIEENTRQRNIRRYKLALRKNAKKDNSGHGKHKMSIPKGNKGDKHQIGQKRKVTRKHKLATNLEDARQTLEESGIKPGQIKSASKLKKEAKAKRKAEQKAKKKEDK